MAQKIPKLNYYLANINAKNMTAIVLHIGHNEQKKKFNTPITIHPKFWDKVKQAVKSTNTNYLKINKFLAINKQKANDYFLDCLLSGEAINYDLLKRILPSNENAEPMGFFEDVYKKFIESKRPNVGAATIKVYNTVLSHLLEIQKEFNYPLNFEAFNTHFETILQRHFITNKGFLNATYNKILKTLKCFLSWAFDNGFHKNTDYKKYKVYYEGESDLIALNINEIKKIQKLELSKTLLQYRDLFIIECFTGLRFGDLKHIKPANIKDGTLSITQSKTAAKIRVPLLPEIMPEIERLMQLKKVPASQKLNDALKVIGKMAELTDLVTLTTYSGAKRMEETKPKYEVISSHTGRRSFCTMALQNGLNENYIRKITGHKTTKSFIKYLKLTDTEVKKSFEKAFS